MLLHSAYRFSSHMQLDSVAYRQFPVSLKLIVPVQGLFAQIACSFQVC